MIKKTITHGLLYVAAIIPDFFPRSLGARVFFTAGASFNCLQISILALQISIRIALRDRLLVFFGRRG